MTSPENTQNEEKRPSLMQRALGSVYHLAGGIVETGLYEMKVGGSYVAAGGIVVAATVAAVGGFADSPKLLAGIFFASVGGIAVAGAGGVALGTLAAHETKDYRECVEEEKQVTLKNRGIKLAATFALACGLGSGYAFNQNISAFIPSSLETQLKQNFSDNKGCELVFEEGKKPTLFGGGCPPSPKIHSWF